MRRDRRKGQSGVETMMLATMLVTILMAMMHLFEVTWATQNSHIRAREAVLHDLHYLSNHSPRDGGVVVAKTPGESSGGAFNYKKAGVDPGSNVPQGVSGLSMDFEATAKDRTRDDAFGSQEIEVTAVISN